jgi:hypothetical protein
VIKIQCMEPDDERWRKWKKRCSIALLKVHAQVARGEAPKISEKIYKGAAFNLKDWFFLSPVAPFFGKCVYCEQKIRPSQHGDVEHFRPKARVTDVNDKMVYFDKDNKSIPHPGYYWLAYDWRNLVPSCILCNTYSHRSEGSRLIGKGTRFPVVGAYATAPGEEALEHPLLLLPTKDDPGDHVEMTETGVLAPKTERGKSTIEILGLNERELPDRRMRVYRDTILKLATLHHAHLLNDTRTRDQLIAEFRDIRAGKAEFSATAQKAMSDGQRAVGNLSVELGQG